MARGASSTHKAQRSWEGAAGTTAWRPTYWPQLHQHGLPAGSGKAAMWRHLCCTATGTSKDSDLPGSLWLGGWKLQFRRCPWSWVGAGAGIALAGGTGRAAGQGSHSYCRGGKTHQGRGPGPKEIACQGLRRAAATHSPLAFSGTATARRRKPPS